MECHTKNHPVLRSYNYDECTSTNCLDQGFASPPRKRIRIYYSEKQREDMSRIHDGRVKAVIEQQLRADLKAKRKQMQEYFSKRAVAVGSRDALTKTSPPARHAIPTMLTNSLTRATSPVTQSAVPMTTSRQTTSLSLNTTSTTCMTCFSTPNRLREPIEEDFSLDSIVMVPFFRIPERNAKRSCSSDNDYRYVSAAKFLGFYRISDRNN